MKINSPDISFIIKQHSNSNIPNISQKNRDYKLDISKNILLKSHTNKIDIENSLSKVSKGMHKIQYRFNADNLLYLLNQNTPSHARNIISPELHNTALKELLGESNQKAVVSANYDFNKLNDVLS